MLSSLTVVLATTVTAIAQSGEYVRYKRDLQLVCKTNMLEVMPSYNRALIYFKKGDFPDAPIYLLKSLLMEGKLRKRLLRSLIFLILYAGVGTICVLGLYPSSPLYGVGPSMMGVLLTMPVTIVSFGIAYGQGSGAYQQIFKYLIRNVHYMLGSRLIHVLRFFRAVFCKDSRQMVMK